MDSNKLSLKSVAALWKNESQQIKDQYQKKADQNNNQKEASKNKLDQYKIPLTKKLTGYNIFQSEYK